MTKLETKLEKENNAIRVEISEINYLSNLKETNKQLKQRLKRLKRNDNG